MSFDLISVKPTAFLGLLNSILLVLNDVLSIDSCVYMELLTDRPQFLLWKSSILLICVLLAVRSGFDLFIFSHVPELV